MACITRWSQVYSAKRESVLEHTAFVALYSYQMCCKYKIQGKERELTLIKALVHDVDEVVTGDIPTPTKYDNDTIRNEIEILERGAAAGISSAAFKGDMFQYWCSAKNITTESGCIIAISDAAAVVYKIWQETSVGNKSFKQFIPNIDKALLKIEAKVMPVFIPEIAILRLFLEELK